MNNPFETTMTVPTNQLQTVTRLLAERGCVILDRGERIATDDGDDAEAQIHVLFLGAEAVTDYADAAAPAA